jgi:hypothetical protein
MQRHRETGRISGPNENDVAAMLPLSSLARLQEGCVPLALPKWRASTPLNCNLNLTNLDGERHVLRGSCSQTAGDRFPDVL